MESPRVAKSRVRAAPPGCWHSGIKWALPNVCPGGLWHFFCRVFRLAMMIFGTLFTVEMAIWQNFSNRTQPGILGPGRDWFEKICKIIVVAVNKCPGKRLDPPQRATPKCRVHHWKGSSLREADLLQNGWIFGKVPKGGGGISEKFAIWFSENEGGGLKAVWNFSENSSVLEEVGFPYPRLDVSRLR